MARIATCTPCGIQFYDSTETRTTCNRCTASQKQRKAKVDKWKRKIADARECGKFTNLLNWYVLQMYWREKLTIPEIADVLTFTEREVQFQIDIARQNAR